MASEMFNTPSFLKIACLCDFIVASDKCIKDPICLALRPVVDSDNILDSISVNSVLVEIFQHPLLY